MPISSKLKPSLPKAVLTAALAATALACLAPPASATECAQHIQAIERRMHSAGASEVTGQAPSPTSKAQASNAEGHAPAPVAPEQSSSPEKMQKAEALLAKAKDQDKAGNKEACEQTMQQVQANMGALP